MTTDIPGAGFLSNHERLKNASALMAVWYAVALHGLWAILLFVSASTLGATAISGPAELFPNRIGLAILFIVVAACALLGIYMKKPSPTKVMLLVPQQIMLGLSAFAAIEAMVHSQFADGIVRPQPFLIADQAPAVLALLVHSATIVYLALLYADEVDD